MALVAASLITPSIADSSLRSSRPADCAAWRSSSVQAR